MKIVVAIHGVGDQNRSETIRSVYTQFGERQVPPLPLVPLGYFSVPGADGGKASASVKMSRLNFPPGSDASQQLRDLRFAEVYWADIPREAAKAGYLIEETKAWARTIVSRVEALFRGRFPKDNVAAFRQAPGVIEEMVEGVRVLENLSLVFGKMGLFRFDLAPLLRDYVNDVQVVTEFGGLRTQILGRFHAAMNAVRKEALRESSEHVEPEIYVVAHSEGTVVSFMAMLQAIAGLDVFDQERKQVDTRWIQHVRGYMTFGSPIDKHILLWDSLWTDIAEKLDQQSRLPDRPQTPRIQWRNYYDRGDPIGFELDTARKFLGDHGCTAFNFEAEHDFGFTRYYLPGKAHVDYWKDKDVFGHFIQDVVLREGNAKLPEPKTKILAWLTSYCVPYGIVVLLHLAAVFLLFRGLDHFAPQDLGPGEAAGVIAALAALLLSATVVARAPRLVRLSPSKPWQWGGMICLMAAVTVVGAVAALTQHDYVNGWVLGGAAAVALAGWLMPRKPRWGRPALLLLGAAATLAYLAWRICFDCEHAGAFSPLVLAAAAFLYLWWLAIVVFDLTFIWHRYIRFAVLHNHLHEWKYDEPRRPKQRKAGDASPQRAGTGADGMPRTS